MVRAVRAQNEFWPKPVYGNYYLRNRLRKRYQALEPSLHDWYGYTDVVILNASEIFKQKQFFCTKLIPPYIETLTCS
jgi:hypothetical protein